MLAALMAIVAVNVWTGSPLLALWIGSRIQGSGAPSMSAVAIVVGLLVAFSVGLLALLNVVGDRYDRLIGRPAGPREAAPWLRSMRDERPEQRARERGLSGSELIVVATVVLAVAAFEVWFFFFSGSPIGGPSGR